MDILERHLDEPEQIWRLGYLTESAKEGRRLLNQAQYQHVLEQFETLARSEILVAVM